MRDRRLRPLEEQHGLGYGYLNNDLLDFTAGAVRREPNESFGGGGGKGPVDQRAGAALQADSTAATTAPFEEAAVGLIGELRGTCVIREEKGTLRLQGSCCPLRALVPGDPLVCLTIEAMVGEYIGLPVQEQCEKGDLPACRLVIGAPKSRA